MLTTTVPAEVTAIAHDAILEVSILHQHHTQHITLLCAYIKTAR